MILFATGALALGGCDKTTKGASSAGASAAEEGEHKLNELTVDEVEARIAKKDASFFVFDNNPKDIFDGGHVPTAKWLAFNEIKASDLPADKEATLVFYCANSH